LTQVSLQVSFVVVVVVAQLLSCTASYRLQQLRLMLIEQVCQPAVDNAIVQNCI
jgi:hypothetical protein